MAHKNRNRRRGTLTTVPRRPVSLVRAGIAATALAPRPAVEIDLTDMPLPGEIPCYGNDAMGSPWLAYGEAPWEADCEEVGPFPDSISALICVKALISTASFPACTSWYIVQDNAYGWGQAISKRWS